jgi:hypothetical protein
MVEVAGLEGDDALAAGPPSSAPAACGRRPSGRPSVPPSCAASPVDAAFVRGLLEQQLTPYRIDASRAQARNQGLVTGYTNR